MSDVNAIIGGFQTKVATHVNLSVPMKQHIVNNVVRCMSSPDGNYNQYDTESLRELHDDIKKGVVDGSENFTDTDLEILLLLADNADYLEIGNGSEL